MSLPSSAASRERWAWTAPGLGQLSRGRHRRDPRLLRDRLCEHVSALPALPAHALRLHAGALRQRMRPAARHAGEAARAAVARIPLPLDRLTLRIESLDSEGRGVARNPDGKVVFVEGALPGEAVSF